MYKFIIYEKKIKNGIPYSIELFKLEAENISEARDYCIEIGCDFDNGKHEIVNTF